MFKFLFVLFTVLALIGYFLSNVLTVEMLDALGPIMNSTSNNTNL